MTKKILTSADSDLFRQHIGKVQAIKNDKVPLQNTQKPKPKPKPPGVNPEHRLVDAVTDAIETLGSEDALSFTMPGLQKNVIKKLRKGHYGLDAEIDLHGLNSNEAKRQLLNFLVLSVEDGCRCVRVVHGKGYRSPDQFPVLKNNLNQWLRQHMDVQAFCSASAKEGGTGALLVLLRVSEKFEDDLM